MSVEDFEDAERFAKELDDKVRHIYPAYADKARAFMNSILRKCDKRLFLVFNGDAVDTDYNLGELHITHSLVCDALMNRDKGQSIPDWYLENLIRSSHGLGLTLIDGGES